MNSAITQAVTILKQGGLVAIPTETVYGLGADARNPEALRKIFQAKQRPIDHPLIVHIAEMDQLTQWVREIPDMAYQLANAFWPGPLTLILPKASSVLDIVTGGQQTVGIRIPRHPVAQALLQQFGGGIAAPSANRFGRISPTTADAVYQELGAAVDLILDGGSCEVGLESTIVDVSRGYPIILRPGMITATQIESVLHQPLSSFNEKTPRVSGSLESHYAPVTRTQLLPGEEISYFLTKLTEADLPIALVMQSHLEIANKKVHCVSMSKNPEVYARQLYQTLRELDSRQLKRIIIEDVPTTVEWLAIRDRLMKASF